MTLVTLVSGGLDSTVMALLTKEEGLTQFPLFIDYGQLGKAQEWAACQNNLRRHHLPSPSLAALQGYGALLPSGLTSPTKHVYEEAFLPNRNLFFLTVGTAFAFQQGATAVAIGLLDEAFHVFPDQTKTFIAEAESLISRSLGRGMRIRTPLMSFSKAEVLGIARSRGVSDTYSCHAGTVPPCGVCIACREYIGLEE